MVNGGILKLFWAMVTHVSEAKEDDKLGINWYIWRSKGKQGHPAQILSSENSRSLEYAEVYTRIHWQCPRRRWGDVMLRQTASFASILTSSFAIGRLISDRPNDWLACCSGATSQNQIRWRKDCRLWKGSCPSPRICRVLAAGQKLPT